ARSASLVDLSFEDDRPGVSCHLEMGGNIGPPGRTIQSTEGREGIASGVVPAAVARGAALQRQLQPRRVFPIEIEHPSALDRTVLLRDTESEKDRQTENTAEKCLSHRSLLLQMRASISASTESRLPAEEFVLRMNSPVTPWLRRATASSTDRALYPSCRT